MFLLAFDVSPPHKTDDGQTAEPLFSSSLFWLISHLMVNDEIDCVCCANFGEEGGASLKACMACKLVKYCNVNCQRNHWPKHKKVCKLRSAELRDEALFKDPSPNEDCPICFLPMPMKLVSHFHPGLYRPIRLMIM